MCFTCICVCAPHVCPITTEARREYQICSYKRLYVGTGDWMRSSGKAALTVQSSLQFPHLFGLYAFYDSQFWPGERRNSQAFKIYFSLIAKDIEQISTAHIHSSVY